MPNLYISYDGRISRRYFWSGILNATLAWGCVTLLVSLAVASLTLVADNQRSPKPDSILLLAANFPALATYAWILLALIVKRCHDRGKSGLWSILLLVPVLWVVWVVIDLGMMPGDLGANDYGPPP